jgi:hypothetical protein
MKHNFCIWDKQFIAYKDTHPLFPCARTFQDWGEQTTKQAELSMDMSYPDLWNFKRMINREVIILRGGNWCTLNLLLSELVVEELKLGTGFPSAHVNTPTHTVWKPQTRNPKRITPSAFGLETLWHWHGKACWINQSLKTMISAKQSS